MDVNIAFLNGELKEDMCVCVCEPKDFVKYGDENKVCQPKKSIYGLKLSF